MTFGARNIDRAPDVFTVKSMGWLGESMQQDTEKAFQEFYELMWRDHGNGWATVFERMIAEMQEYDERMGKFKDIPPNRAIDEK